MTDRLSPENVILTRPKGENKHYKGLRSFLIGVVMWAPSTPGATDPLVH